jgi:solute carrier family 10 (sodium/bile acid cotransporter), member 7
MHRLTRLSFDGFTAALAVTVMLASSLPARGAAAPAVEVAANLGIALLFFLHGARLSPGAALAGAAHWRLHAMVFGATFLFFPLLGLALHPLIAAFLPPTVALGVLFLCSLPSTVQSSIAFTSIAGGNVPAAVFSASTSSLIGIVLTPALIGLLAQVHGTAFSLTAVRAILLQLVLPFLVGQLLHRWIGGWAERNRRLLRLVDRGSILLIVYSAFSAAVVNGLWHQLSPVGLGVLVAVDALLLAIVLAATVFASRRLGFSRADEITIMFCGSKKSLASGIPIASILFPAHAVGMIVLPIMLFHQIQLLVCATLARRYARSSRPTMRVGGDLRPAPPRGA